MSWFVHMYMLYASCNLQLVGGVRGCLVVVWICWAQSVDYVAGEKELVRPNLLPKLSRFAHFSLSKCSMNANRDEIRMLGMFSWSMDRQRDRDDDCFALLCTCMQ